MPFHVAGYVIGIAPLTALSFVMAAFARAGLALVRRGTGWARAAGARETTLSGDGESEAPRGPTAPVRGAPRDACAAMGVRGALSP